jgi:hypothetical protein
MRVQVVLPKVGPQRFGVFQERTLRGELVASTTDSLFLRLHPSAGVITIPRGVMVEMFESEGPPSRWRSAVRALPLGILFGAAMANGLFDAELRGPGFRTRRDALVSGAIFGAFANAAGGALVPTEQWKPLRP